MFTQAQACEITGLSRASIQTRVNRGQVRLAKHNPGRQAKRLFSVLDLIKLSFIEQMSRHHFSSGAASVVAEEVAAHALRWWKTHPETTGPFFDTATGQVRDDDLPAISLKMSKEGWQSYFRLAVFTNEDGITEVQPFKMSEDEYWFFEQDCPNIYTVIQIDVLISRIINQILRFIHEETKK